MAAMHEDDSPDLREVGRILEESLQVHASLVPLVSILNHSSLSVEIINIVCWILSDVRSIFESKNDCRESLRHSYQKSC